MPQWEPDGVTPASPRVYRAMLRAGYAAVKTARRSKKVTVLIGNTSSTQGKRGAGPVAPLEFLRDLACVDVKLKPRTTPDCVNFQTLPGDGWAHHPYSQNERPSRVSKAPRGDRRPAHGRPAQARHDARPAREDGPPGARQPQHLPDGVRLRDPAGHGPPDDQRADAGQVADVGGVPRRQAADRALVRAVLAARPAAGAGAGLRQRRAPLRPVLDRPAARQRQGQDRRQDRSSPASTRRRAARAA